MSDDVLVCLRMNYCIATLPVRGGSAVYDF